MKQVHDQAYEKFLEITGIQISRRTFYRMKREVQSGEGNRLARIIDNAEVPVSERPRAKRQRDIDSRPFVAYDGEGRTLEGKHRYVLLACSNGESLYRPRGISTVEALDFLLRSRRNKCIRVFYSFGYDVQQILVDLSDEQLIRAMHGQPVKYRGYTIQYLHGKIFTVNNVRFYDVFNYWQTSFIKACYLTLGKDKVPEDLIRGKEDRSNFAEWSIDDILRYTNIELDLLVQLAEHLRTVLLRADIHLGTAFYGPGSIANYWFKHHSISPRKITDPTLVDVMERGYYGGRFETFILGKSEPVYECDINSAYPAVLSKLPYLDEWEKWSGSLFTRSSDFSIWHIKWSLPSDTKIGPFPSRDRHGLISYPANGIGWYWKPEVEAAIALYGSTISIIEGYNPSVVEGEPFAWVEDVYNRRQELKDNNDPAQWALKVGLNSLYGKAAQRVGSAKFFSLAWAGYITSATRAKLLRSVIGRTDDVIAFATDAVYFNRRPNLVSSKSLGGWSVQRWARGYYFQSGVYRLESDKDHKDAYRGFSVKNGIQDLIDQINENPFKHPSIYQTKFVGHLEAIRAPEKLGPHRLCFIVMRKKLQPYKTTKRRVDDPDLYDFMETIWFDGNDEQEAFIVKRGTDYTLGRYEDNRRGHNDIFVWNNYRNLLKKAIPTKILENHNDHRSFTRHEIGELEESYPFKPLADRNDDLSLQDSDGIAEERIGGAAGIIDIHKIGNLPVIDEDEIVQELTQ